MQTSDKQKYFSSFLIIFSNIYFLYELSSLFQTWFYKNTHIFLNFSNYMRNIVFFLFFLEYLCKKNSFTHQKRWYSHPIFLSSRVFTHVFSNDLEPVTTNRIFRALSCILSLKAKSFAITEQGTFYLKRKY